MIIRFQESYYIWYKPYVHVLFRQELLSKDYLPALKELLKNKFESIIFSPEVTEDFRFENDADDAAFLLWSSDGVELS
jgi:hypothetical protein